MLFYQSLQVAQSEHTAARTPFTLFAAMEIPTPGTADQDSAVSLAAYNCTSYFLSELRVITALIAICSKIYNFVSKTFHIVHDDKFQFCCCMIVSNCDFHF